MATSGYLYYDITNHHGHHLQPSMAPPGIPHTSDVIPKLSQPIDTREHLYYYPHRQNTPVSAMKPLKPGQNYREAYQRNKCGVSAAPQEGDYPSEYKPPAARPMSRSDTLKRRSSLREAARSLRPSKVAKRLRQVMGDANIDNEDADDAGASASESDYSAETSYEYGRSSLSSDQNKRHQSVVSDLTSDIQDSLNIGGANRGRLSSSASQASTLVMDGSDSASTNTSLKIPSHVPKTCYSTEDDATHEDGDEDSDRLARKLAPISSLGPEQPQLFACPFAKHAPQRYSAANLDELNYRGCAQSYLTDLARVKQHLYRVHERPLHHCPKCYDVFKSQAQCVKHVASQSCTGRPCPFDERMTAEQLAAIKKKNRGTDPYLGWYEIYKTLFPGAQLPLSPYAAFTANVDTLESFMDYVIRELPTRLQNQLGMKHLSIETIQGSLPTVLRDIRKDFQPPPHCKQEAVFRSNVVSQSTDATENDATAIPNFYQMVTTTLTEPDSTQSRRSSAQDLPVNDNYGYVSTQVTQVLSKSVPSTAQFTTQSIQQSINPHYMYQQFNYNIPNQNMGQGVNSGPPTAIWQPDEQESVNGYFAVPHQANEMLPSHMIQVQNEESWIPTMITTRIDQSLNDSGINDMLNGMFYGGFANQHR